MNTAEGQKLVSEATTAHRELDKLHVPRSEGEDMLSVWGRIQALFNKDTQAVKIEQCRSDLERVRGEINKGKRLLVELYEKFPAAREMISERTGPWFAFGVDRGETNGMDDLIREGSPQPSRMTTSERAGWLADKICNGGDYAKEAASLLRMWPAHDATYVGMLTASLVEAQAALEVAVGRKDGKGVGNFKTSEELGLQIVKDALADTDKFHRAEVFHQGSDSFYDAILISKIDRDHISGKTPHNGMRAVHPVEIIREDYMKPEGLGLEAFAAKIGVDPGTLHPMFYNNAPLTEDVAKKIAAAYGGTDSDAEGLMALQRAYEGKVTLQDAPNAQGPRFTLTVREAETAPETCDDMEQERFEALAKFKNMSLARHPMFYIFSDKETAAMREGWREGIAYAVERYAQFQNFPTARGFDAVWKGKEEEGYKYGREPLANVQFGWQLACEEFRKAGASREHPLYHTHADLFLHHTKQWTINDAILAQIKSNAVAQAEIDRASKKPVLDDDACAILYDFLFQVEADIQSNDSSDEITGILFTDAEFQQFCYVLLTWPITDLIAFIGSYKAAQATE